MNLRYVVNMAERELIVGSQTFRYFSLAALQDARVGRLPFCIRILLENVLRNCDGFEVKQADVEHVLNWEVTSHEDVEVPFKPARVMFPDYPGVAALVDLAAMRDAMRELGGDPEKINPVCPLTLVVDHSISADYSRSPEALALNEAEEMTKNRERYEFLKWGQKAFRNMALVPPSSGIIHQIHLEHVAAGVCQRDSMLFPDSLVASDSHTATINGAGVFGWGVGGIECESVMLGQSVALVLPEVVGVKLENRLHGATTVTDLVLSLTNGLRKMGVVGKFVEFFGPGCSTLSVEDRATVANMCPEYGATIAFFATDEITLKYYEDTGRRADLIRAYYEAQQLLRSYTTETATPAYSHILEFDLASVLPCVAGPKRPQDKVALTALKSDFHTCLTGTLGFKGFAAADPQRTVPFTYQGRDYVLTHGSVVLASITACTNTANSNVMLAAGLLARKARQAGLQTADYIKTSLSPGSHVTEQYLKAAGLMEDLEALGFHIVGFGCMTCVGNSGELPSEVTQAIETGSLVVASVLSGNRNFEGRVHPLTKANYLASPPLIVAFALAGRVDIDWETEPLGQGSAGPVYLRDIWPSTEEIAATKRLISSEMYTSVYGSFGVGNALWQQLPAAEGLLYPWPSSSYIHKPQFFAGMQRSPEAIPDITNARCVAFLGDSITTDHISPIGRISKIGATARYLQDMGVQSAAFHSYGARRGNDEVMARGTFVNPHIVNQLVGRQGALTRHFPSGDTVEFFEAAERYRAEGVPLVVLAGKEYGTGSSRDWAAKGPWMLGVRAILAESFERIHRSNLVGMGILPLQLHSSAQTLGLTGSEQFSVSLREGDLKVKETLEVRTEQGLTFPVTARLDTEVEVAYFRHGGILKFVIRKLL